MDNDYPILKTKLGFPSVLLAPHEAQAMRNHGGQTLAILRERGGLAPCEMLAILEDRRWREMSFEEAYGKLVEYRRIAETEGTRDENPG